MAKKDRSEYLKQYRRTKEGVAITIYSHQRGSSKKRGHEVPTYSKDDLREWLFNQEKFHYLFENWERSGYLKALKPSVDRIDDSIGYTMTNIQLMTWRENNKKAHSDMRGRKLVYEIKSGKAVRQYTRDGAYIAEYVSVREAERQTGADNRRISMCCNGKRNHTGGFKWEFKNKDF